MFSFSITKSVQNNKLSGRSYLVSVCVVLLLSSLPRTVFFFPFLSPRLSKLVYSFSLSHLVSFFELLPYSVWAKNPWCFVCFVLYSTVKLRSSCPTSFLFLTSPLIRTSISDLDSAYCSPPTPPPTAQRASRKVSLLPFEDPAAFYFEA